MFTHVENTSTSEFTRIESGHETLVRGFTGSGLRATERRSERRASEGPVTDSRIPRTGRPLKEAYEILWCL